jgi:hypothetical protein
MNAAGQAYIDAHRTWMRRKGRVQRREVRNLASAIGRLIDQGELTWNPKTDDLEITAYGRQVAVEIAWWWDQRVAH